MLTVAVENARFKQRCSWRRRARVVSTRPRPRPRMVALPSSWKASVLRGLWPQHRIPPRTQHGKAIVYALSSNNRVLIRTECCKRKFMNHWYYWLRKAGMNSFIPRPWVTVTSYSSFPAVVPSLNSVVAGGWVKQQIFDLCARGYLTLCLWRSWEGGSEHGECE